MKNKKTLFLFIAIIVISCGLRAPITGVGSLVSTIREGLGLSSASAGMLTTIPLITIGIISVFVGHFSDKLGAGKVMLAGLFLLVVGIVLRTFAGASGLFLGTAIIGTGIAVGNVLIPAFIKAFFPEKVGIMTSAYTTVMSVFAGVSGGISVPLANKYGWQLSLFIWIIPVIVALLLWMPNRNMVLAAKAKSTSKGSSIINDSMTWLVSFYMGVQSLLFYCFVAWFATILQSRGFDSSVAGYYNSIYMLLGIPGSLVVPILAGKSKNQSKLGISLGIIYIIGLAAMLLSGGMPALIISIICCGFCSGACISFSMVLFGLHTKNAADTSALSGLAQSVGYLLAAIGPIALGKIYDIFNNWTVPLSLLLILALILTVLGCLVGREKIIND